MDKGTEVYYPVYIDLHGTGEDENMLKKMQKCGLVVGIMAALFIMTGCGQKAPEKTAQESAAAVETAAEETAAEEAGGCHRGSGLGISDGGWHLLLEIYCRKL